MNRWIRLHQSALHNPKLVTLSDRQHRAWTNCLLMADPANGSLPSIRDIACHLRMSVQDAELVLSELVEVDLIDMAIAGGVRTFKMHDWQTHQYTSDNSTERVRKFRSKNKCNDDETLHETERNVSETPPESYTDTDTDSLGLLSSQAAARTRDDDDQGGVNKFGKGKDGKKEKIVRRAEGLGVPVDDLIAACNEHKAKNRSAYFTKLCVEYLQRRLPGLEENLIRAALWDRDETQYAAVMRLLVGVA